MAQINLGHVVGEGVPSGGSAGQILKKNSATNFDTAWTTLNSGNVPVSASDSTTVQQALSALKSDIGIVEDGNTATHTIASGQYVIWKGSLYIASAAIPSGTTLSTSNLTAVSDGGLNSLNANIATVNSDLEDLSEEVDEKLTFVPAGSVNSSSPKTVTVTNNGKYILVTIGGNNRSGLYSISVGSDGAVTVITLFNASSITVASNANNKVTISSGASASALTYIMCFNGSAVV